MTLEESVQKIYQIALQTGVSPSTSPLMDNSILAELLLPRVVDVVTQNIVKDPQQLNVLRAEHTLSFTSGKAALPATVKEEYAEAIMFPVQDATYVKQWFSYSNRTELLLDRFHIRDGFVYYRAVGENITAHSGSEIMDAITYPSVPATAASSWTCKANVLEQIHTFAASILTGQVPLSAIGLDYSQINA